MQEPSIVSRENHLGLLNAVQATHPCKGPNVHFNPVLFVLQTMRAPTPTPSDRAMCPIMHVRPFPHRFFPRRSVFKLSRAATRTDRGKNTIEMISQQKIITGQLHLFINFGVDYTNIQTQLFKSSRQCKCSDTKAGEPAHTL